MWTTSTVFRPAISIDQKTTSQNPRSTVGTVTEIYDYLRLLWARVGTPHCPKCGKEIHQQTIDQIIDRLMALAGKNARAAARAGRPRQKGRAREGVRGRPQAGLCPRARGRRDSRPVRRDSSWQRTKKHTIEIVVDRVVIRPDARGRITDSVETALGAVRRACHRGCYRR